MLRWQSYLLESSLLTTCYRYPHVGSSSLAGDILPMAHMIKWDDNQSRFFYSACSAPIRKEKQTNKKSRWDLLFHQLYYEHSICAKSILGYTCRIWWLILIKKLYFDWCVVSCASENGCQKDTWNSCAIFTFIEIIAKEYVHQSMIIIVPRTRGICTTYI